MSLPSFCTSTNLHFYQKYAFCEGTVYAIFFSGLEMFQFSRPLSIVKLRKTRNNLFEKYANCRLNREVRFGKNLKKISLYRAYENILIS